MSALINMTGQRFGYLLVLKRLPNQGKKTMWQCQCNCGNQVAVSGSNLRSGHSTSCGCKKMEARSSKDLTGQIFGEWTVLEKSQKSRYWKCKCSCGIERDVYGPSLKSGKSKSCGKHSNRPIRKSLVGQTFDYLTVLEHIINENKERKCKCRCICGKIIYVNRSNLTGENGTKSCGLHEKRYDFHE